MTSLIGEIIKKTYEINTRKKAESFKLILSPWGNIMYTHFVYLGIYILRIKFAWIVLDEDWLEGISVLVDCVCH